MDMMAVVLSGYILALVAPLIARLAGRAAGWILAFLPAAIVTYFLTILRPVLHGEVTSYQFRWVPSLGLNLSFRVDGLAYLFVLLIAGIGALILIYAGGYLGKHPLLGRAYCFLLIFMASMLGLVLADNVLALFLFWELTSISSYLLIGFDHERAEARTAALQALLVTGGGGLALLAGLLLLGQLGGAHEISLLQSSADTIQSHPLYLPCLLLILLGAFTKSAQFPFHFWLPNAMEAPTPISAYLHSATMVKAGIYLLLRLTPILGGTSSWYWIISGTGVLTMVITTVTALAQSDLKRILAYSTLGALGVLTFLIGLGGATALKGALVFLLAHALYKGSLFLVAGTIDHETGTRDIDRLRGLWRPMPVTAFASALAGLSMAGIIPLFGFVGKELVLESALDADFRWLWTSLAVLTASFLVAVGGMVGLRPLFGDQKSTPSPPHEGAIELWLGSITLALLGLGLGLMPGIGDNLMTAAVSAVTSEETTVHLSLWHGFNPALVLSGVSMGVGILLYYWRGEQRRLAGVWRGVLSVGPARWYEIALAGLNGIAALQTRLLQSGYLRYYILIVLVVTAILPGLTLLRHGWLEVATDLSSLRFYDAGLVLLILPAIFAAVRFHSPLPAIASLGVVGYGVSLIFVLYGAPDVAMTQFLVETLTVILFVLVFYHVPTSSRRADVLWNGRDLLVSASVGCLMTVLVLVAAALQHAPPISDYFIEHSYAEAHGRNIVNVILVDFRALDTLGEMTVLGIAGIGVYGLLKLRAQAPSNGNNDHRSDPEAIEQEPIA